MSVVLCIAAGIAAAPVGQGPAALQPPLGVAPVEFLDGGAVRVVERGAPGQGVFVDPATGRRAPVRFGNDVIVALPPAADLAAVAASLSLHAPRALSDRLRLYLVESAIAGEDALALAARLMPAVRGGVIDQAYPNLAFRHRLSSIPIPPDDPLYGDQFFLEDIDIEDAWAIGTGAADVEILIADNGCDLAHPDLVDKLEPGYDFVEDDDDPTWKPGGSANHGTACAGLAAASTNNGIGIAGACPECRLRCARMIPGPDEPVPLAADIATFDYALDVDADVMSNSWGFVDPIPVPAPLRAAIEELQQLGRGGRGAVVVFAAGNESHIIADDELLAVDGVLGVGAVSNIGELTQYTNGGDSVDVVAPTGAVAPDISGPDGSEPGDTTTTFSGTSSACPIVAGLAALMIADDPELSADEVNQAFIATARQSLLANPDEAGHDRYFGYGLVQPAAAMVFYDPPAPPPPAPETCGSCAHAPLTSVGLVALLAGLAGCRRARRTAPPQPPRARASLATPGRPCSARTA